MTLLALGFLAAGCSTFDRDWDALLAASPDGYTGVEGPWQGSWKSESTGQEGAMRWIVSRDDEGKYQARRQTQLALFFSAEHILPLDVERDGDAILFRGDMDLGAMEGGKFHYEGRVDGDELTATYRSRYDFGSYRMKRPWATATAP